MEPEDLWPDEWVAWFRLTPQERWEETAKLWQIYLTLGGSLDPEPDTQSPFNDLYYPKESNTRSVNERPGIQITRRSGV